jgi:uncharacterized protein YlxP (DUF503 family)
MLVVGILEVTLRLEGNHSLKEKRKVVKSILSRVRARFNASASEVGSQDIHGEAVVAFSVCGSNAQILNGVLDRLMNFVEANADAEVADSRQECSAWLD